ncbi:molybdenum cofactor guanylyltransferase [Loigolactobacillus jiayinensis]|uniref:Molybdenum cofactor guanylyltransferase n=1 Tax=Loigolactobacillus jiayinensis TaxID=2486016 RepID=A0ABW1RFK8_9LACO|nr:molybdenum cofactor guanylyltransferase [Loigolactobacillus jiayinensis]
MAAKAATSPIMLKNKPTGIVLAGGRSRRFGRDKALAIVAAQTQPNVVLAVQHLLPLTAQIFIAANADNAVALQHLFATNDHVQVCVDQPEFTDCGPLGGLYAVTAQQPRRRDYLMVATDYPYLTPDLLTKLAQQPRHFLQTPAQAHYALAHFYTEQATVRQFLTSGQRRLQTFIVNIARCQPLNVPASNALTNLNQNIGSEPHAK